MHAYCQACKYMLDKVVCILYTSWYDVSIRICWHVLQAADPPSLVQKVVFGILMGIPLSLVSPQRPTNMAVCLMANMSGIPSGPSL